MFMKFESLIQKATVIGVYSSKHPPNYTGDNYFVTEARSELVLDFGGVVGDRHYGTTEPSDSRAKSLYAKGTEIRNNRQWSAISCKELEVIASNLSIPSLSPELAGVNFLLDGVESVSGLVSMTYVVLSSTAEFTPQHPNNVVLVCYGQMMPCTIAGKALVVPHKDESLETRFPKSALGLRGISGWVEKGGIVRPNYSAFILRPTGKD